MELIGQFKRLGKDTLLYGVGFTLTKFMSFLLFPVYTRLLTQADFGSQDLIMTFVLVLSIFLVLGMDSGLLLHYYSASDEDKEVIQSTWLWSELVISLSVCTLLWIFATPICRIVFNSPDLVPYFRLGILSVPFGRVVAAILFVLRLTFKTGKYVILSVAGVLFQMLAAILFVVVWHMGVSGVFLAILVASALQMIIGVTLTYRQFRLVFSFQWLKALLVVGIPLVPAGISYWILTYSNRYFLMRSDTLSNIGMLGVAVRISSMLLLVISAFEMAWGPFAYSLAKKPDIARRTYGKVLTYFLLLSVVAAAFLSIFAREIIRLVAIPSYESIAALVPLYCFSSISYVCLYIVGMGAGIVKKTYHNTLAVILGAAANTGGNMLLIPLWGITGAALSTLLGNLVALVYMYFVGQHYFRVTYEYKEIFILNLASVVSIGVGIALDKYFAVWDVKVLFYKAVVATLFILMLFLFRVIRRDSLEIAWDLLRARLRKVGVNESTVKN